VSKLHVYSPGGRGGGNGKELQRVIAFHTLLTVGQFLERMRSGRTLDLSTHPTRQGHTVH
jgi:hypothetical protein